MAVFSSFCVVDGTGVGTGVGLGTSSGTWLGTGAGWSGTGTGTGAVSTTGFSRTGSDTSGFVWSFDSWLPQPPVPSFCFGLAPHPPPVVSGFDDESFLSGEPHPPADSFFGDASPHLDGLFVFGLEFHPDFVSPAGGDLLGGVRLGLRSRLGLRLLLRSLLPPRSLLRSLLWRSRLPPRPPRPPPRPPQPRSGLLKDH